MHHNIHSKYIPQFLEIFFLIIAVFLILLVSNRIAGIISTGEKNTIDPLVELVKCKLHKIYDRMTSVRANNGAHLMWGQQMSRCFS